MQTVDNPTKYGAEAVGQDEVEDFNLLKYKSKKYHAVQQKLETSFFAKSSYLWYSPAKFISISKTIPQIIDLNLTIYGKSHSQRHLQHEIFFYGHLSENNISFVWYQVMRGTSPAHLVVDYAYP